MPQSQIVYLVDDDSAACESLAFLLRAKGFEVACFRSAHQFLDSFDINAVACLVLDIQMPAIDGLELQQLLIDRGVEVPVIFISGHADVPIATSVLRKGALDLIEKPVDGERLAKRILDAFEISSSCQSVRRRRTKIREQLGRLTDREREVLPLILEGNSLKQIAGHFGVTVPTASRHQCRVFEKLEVDSFAQLIRLLNSAKLDISEFG